MNHTIKILKNLQYPSGLIAAAAKHVRTGYNKAWLRDNIYASLGFEAAQDIGSLKKTYHALLDLLIKHEYKIDWMIKQPYPKLAWRYIHARYDPETFEEFLEEWGNKQNDAVGAILFKIGDLTIKGVDILRDENDVRILQKLVNYLAAIEYWHDADNGMWEENEELHASSIGACLAGLIAVKEIVNVSEGLIAKGREALNNLLPRESATKFVDLALLSLIYPYNIITEKQGKEILKNVETYLLRERGVCRYIGDKYYHNGTGEAEWTMGFAWLAVIYHMLGNKEKYEHYQNAAKQAMNENSELPELYFSQSTKYNENTPLAWATALMMVAEHG
ncbi:MAG: glycoside hydrolase family 15 [Candidatus Aenigmarchaeota archaeon]|nr:glycoside hydrolase family 15 [Candidatus Aenigmarchaeota archaeon]